MLLLLRCQVVLVDHYSASTSELLAGALRDDNAAVLLGERTYGKGRTQRVIGPLAGGATLLVSTDVFVTPALTPVDRVGLRPDVYCKPGPPPPVGVRVKQAGGGEVAGGEEVDGRALLQDRCVKEAVDRLTRGSVRVRQPGAGPGSTLSFRVEVVDME